MNIKLSRNGELCPACGEGHLTSKVGRAVEEYKGHSEPVNYHYSECDICGSTLAGKLETAANNRLMTAFYKKVDGLLPSEEIKNIRTRYDFTQEVAASLFGGGKVAFSRYENDEISQAISMDSLIRICQRNPYNFLLLAEIRNVELSTKQKAKIEAEYHQDLIDNGALIQKILNDDLNRKLGEKFDNEYLPCANDPIFKDSVVRTWTWTVEAA